MHHTSLVCGLLAEPGHCPFPAKPCTLTRLWHDAGSGSQRSNGPLAQGREGGGHAARQGLREGTLGFTERKPWDIGEKQARVCSSPRLFDVVEKLTAFPSSLDSCPPMSHLCGSYLAGTDCNDDRNPLPSHWDHGVISELSALCGFLCLYLLCCVLVVLPCRFHCQRLLPGQGVGKTAGSGLNAAQALPHASQEEWKASLKELLGWTGGSERSRLSAQRHNAALQEVMQR